MKYILIPIALLSSIFIFSFTKTLHGEGKIVTNSRTVPSFDAVELDFPVSATITVQDGAKPGVDLNAYENIIGEIKTKVKGTTLVIYCEPNLDIQTHPNVTARITLPALTGLSISGSSVATIVGNVKGKKLSIEISGFGSAAADAVNVTDLTTSISGSGSIKVNSGNVTHSDYEINGSGSIKALGLNTRETKTTISGSGSNEVSASEKLSITIHGSGAVRYKGHPPVINKDIAGSGIVKSLD